MGNVQLKSPSYNRNQTTDYNDVFDTDDENVLYKDLHLELRPDSLVINHYYFPFLTAKTIALKDIRSVRVLSHDFRTFKWVMWGFRFSRSWWHYDLFRGDKPIYMVLDTNSFWKPTLSPGDVTHFNHVLLQQLYKLNNIDPEERMNSYMTKLAAERAQQNTDQNDTD